MKTTSMPAIAAAYVDAINAHDPDRFIALFAEDALVDDAGRQFRGQEAIQRWSASDIFAVNVTLDVLAATQRGEQCVITTKVDGDFDRTGLPDPVIIDQTINSAAGKIVALTCRLATEKAAE